MVQLFSRPDFRSGSQIMLAAKQLHNLSHVRSEKNKEYNLVKIKIRSEFRVVTSYESICVNLVRRSFKGPISF